MLWLLLLGAACSDEAIGVVTPAIVVEPAAIDLGATPVGTVARHSLAVISAGTAPLEVRSALLVPADGSTPLSADLALALPEALPRKLATTQSLVLELQHLPRDARLDFGMIRIESDDPEQPVLDVPIRQEPSGRPELEVVPDVDAAEVEAGTAGGIRTSVASIGFGSVTPGQRRVERIFVVEAGGENLPLILERVSIVEEGIQGLSVTTDPELGEEGVVISPLIAGGVRPSGTRSVELEVSWAPPDSTPLRATLRIESNDPRRPSIDLPITSGDFEPGLEVLPPRLDFGTVRVGASATAAVTLRNTGSVELELSEATLPANPGGVFSFVTAPAAATLAPGMTREVALRYTPVAAQSDAGLLRITPSNGPAAQDVTLAGRGEIDAMACVPAAPDPAEPANEACMGAVERGAITLQISQTERADWSDAMIEAEQDADWSRFTLEVTSGCDFVGYEVTARAAVASGERVEVCIHLGECATPERSDCATGSAQARVLLFPGDDLCNASGNRVPVFVEVRHLSGTPACTPYRIDFTAR